MGRVAREPREVERVEFAAGAPAPVAAYMARLAGAGDGWINLVPRDADDPDRPTLLSFFTLFGGDRSGLTMATWIPGRSGRRGPVRARVGITHVTGRRALDQLRAAGVPVPQTWTVEQDHPRRGLVLSVPLDEPHDDVLAWSLRATAALAPDPIRRWRADIHLPA